MTDERKGKPSASNKWLECPGSGEAIRKLPIVEKKQGADAATGTKRHDLIEKEADEFDSQGDEYAVTRALEKRQEAIEAVFKQKDIDAGLESIKEQRLWLYNDGFDPIFSGQFDELLIGGKTALIIDYKTLFADHGEANKNPQLRDYVVLVHEKHEIAPLHVALIQPNLPKDKQLTIAKFEKKLIDSSKTLLLKKLERHNADAQPRIPGDYCEFCPARVECPERMGDTFSMVQQTHDIARPVTSEELYKIDLAEKMIKDLKAARRAIAMQQLKADPHCLPGYRINPGKITNKTAAGIAWPLMVQKVPGLVFAEACTLSIPKLVKPYHGALAEESKREGFKPKTQKEVRDILDELLEPASTTTIGEPFVEKK